MHHLRSKKHAVIFRFRVSFNFGEIYVIDLKIQLIARALMLYQPYHTSNFLNTSWTPV